jgi:hypothetical protein
MCLILPVCESSRLDILSRELHLPDEINKTYWRSRHLLHCVLYQVIIPRKVISLFLWLSILMLPAVIFK